MLRDSVAGAVFFDGKHSLTTTFIARGIGGSGVMPTTLDVGDLSVEPGEFKTGSLDGIELNTSTSIDVPVMAMNGAEEGPTLVLFSTQHGLEVQNIGIVHKVMRNELDPETIRGSVIALPIANPLAYMHHTYRSWIDNRDIGYISAEKPNGNTSQRIANVIWEEVWSQGDLVINYHANIRDDSLFYQSIRVSEGTKDDCERLARAFGLTTIYHEEIASSGTAPTESFTATLRHLAQENNIPSLTVETISGRAISDPSQTVGVTGTLNVMKEFDMIDGKQQPQEEVDRLVECRYTGGTGINTQHSMVYANRGGLFYPQKMPGDFIEEGEVIAEIRDPYGELLEAVEMPVDGYIWAYPGGQQFASAGTQTMETGGMVAFVFVHEEE
jgi:predicted deacylase